MTLPLDIFFCISPWELSFVEILSLLTAFASFFTAFAALLTVRQIKKQKEQASLPDLIISKDIPIQLRKWKIGKHFIPHGFAQNDDNVVTDEGAVGLVNVGFAAAKDVTYTWKFDLEKAINQIKEYDLDSIFNLDFSSGDSLNTSISNTDYFHIEMTTNQLRGKLIHYVVPTQQNQELVKIGIPSFFLNLYAIYVHLFFKNSTKIGLKERNNNPFSTDLKEFEPLYLELEYSSVSKKTFKSDFKLTMNFHSHWGFAEDDEENTLFGEALLKVT